MEIKFNLTGPEIQQLREVIDNLPLRTYAPLIVKVLKALPMEPDSMILTPLTDEAKEKLPEIQRILAPIIAPHGDEL